MSAAATLEIITPRWALPLIQPMRYKGAKGGRGSGKSHIFAEMAVERMLEDPTTDVVCLREVQQSLKFSSKKVIEKKILDFGASSSFKILDNEIRRVKGRHTGGVMIFQGMRDYTADTIKSLEGFNVAWFEEAQRMSQRSMEFLLPTIREPGSELWFSWNPDQETDPIEKLLVQDPPENSVVVHINFEGNIFCPQVIIDEAAEAKRRDPESWEHIWHGAYNTKSDDQILIGAWREDAFDIDPSWDGPYYGADWGFSTDPNTLIEIYVDTPHQKLMISRELWGEGIEVVQTPDFFAEMTGCERYPIRGDNARPEIISHMKRNGYPRMRAAEKWDGSIVDGISHIRGYEEMVVHPRCIHTLFECKNYKYKRDRLTNEVTPDIIDKHNHCIDAIRYGVEPFTKRKPKSIWDDL